MPALIAHSHFHLTVFYAALFACFAPEWIGTFFQRVEKGARVRDRGSHVWIVMAVGMGVVAGIILVNANFPGTTLQRGQRLQFWIGIAVMLSGLAFRWYAIKSLGRFFTRTVATRSGQYVVDSGPYRLIRHPSYTGGLLMFLGAGIAMTNWAALLAIMAGAALGYGYRVHVEERALCADLGQPYRDYMLRTKRFIPHVL
ncbi:MAG TPA: isoprenylcysteine carboxylmethyltransferase family protein [Rhodanobacteraceae bacterium]|jgi:protein-S-isoprenylcysteine O-methyltransferase Ste14|nr:isoprenylcysteine carboxylmethyltransferase family protein [Rhodanobacteraceae bacterium]